MTKKSSLKKFRVGDLVETNEEYGEAMTQLNLMRIYANKIPTNRCYDRGVVEKIERQVDSMGSRIVFKSEITGKLTPVYEEHLQKYSEKEIEMWEKTKTTIEDILNIN